jgi:hypothetical protein
MARKCYISFKTEDYAYKNHIQNNAGIDMIDRSLDQAIDSTNEDYILRRIREDYLADTTVTLHLIGQYSAENLGQWEQRFIKRELQASLYNGIGNTRSGILGIVLPSMTNVIIGSSYYCSRCGGNHNFVGINDTTVVTEFSYNYYIPNGKCAHSEEERYCVLAGWEQFLAAPEFFIEKAFAKRFEPIANKVRVYGK